MSINSSAEDVVRPEPVGHDNILSNYQSTWGITPAFWLWGVRLRILMVIDGRINTGSSPNSSDGFGLGPVLKTLRSQFAWWVRLEVDVADRDEADMISIFGITIPRPGPKYYNFRFNQDGFDLNEYDQVWFFGDWPGEETDYAPPDDSVIAKPEYGPLSDEELFTLADWMDRGGGVFATGDHGLLGASMCSRIPRVRTMRKWTHAQGVPLIHGETSHETAVRVPGGDREIWEGDRWPQSIRPVLRSSGSASGIAFAGRYPHPLLCSPTGAIDQFPDHMHEGAVVADDDVELAKPLNIPGYGRPEYPAPHDVVLAAQIIDDATMMLGPRPEVIAYGITTTSENPGQVFPLIGVYDGDRVGLGRVVVDSTWHHWFSMNLVGFQTDNPSVYRDMQAYYRNVAVWLATPKQRAAMLFFATWGALTGSAPMTFSPGMSLWQLGERALDVIGRTASQCIIDDLVVALASPRRTETKPSDAGAGPPWPTLPDTIVRQAMVGGIGAALLERSSALRRDVARGRKPSVNLASVWNDAASGVGQGQRALQAALKLSVQHINRLSRDIATDVELLDAEGIAVTPAVEEESSAD